MLFRSLRDWVREQFAANPAGTREVLRPSWRLAPLEARRVLDADVTFDPTTQLLLVNNFTDTPGGGGTAPQLQISDQLADGGIDATRLVLAGGEQFNLDGSGGSGGGGSGG
ncbi:MAG: hypothetical protein ACK5F7_11260, partial [Planctomycetaceae bacterium]